MISFILRRLLWMIPTLIAISIISFLIIQAPPGDFLTTYVGELMAKGEVVDHAEIAALKVRYGLDEPIYVQYFKWIWGVLHGDLGRSLEWNRNVSSIIAERLPWSMTISLASFIFVYLVAIPIATVSATRQYSIMDYIFTFIGFIGLAIPNFLLALVALWFYFSSTGDVLIGLFSDQFIMEPLSIAKLLDLFKHLWVPTIIVGTAGTAGLIRVMRATLLDELQKPYVMVAHAKGLTERKVLYKYPFRIAINPVISTIGWTLPALVSGELIVSLVLNIPTLAPIFLKSLQSQDMFLAGSVVLILSLLTVIGTLISDILLAWVDPRIRQSV